MSRVLIRKSPPVVVAPSEPVTAIADDISLRHIEKLMIDTAVMVIVVFEHPIQDPVETIKRALSRALVYYYPLAGRFANGPAAGDLVIKCSGEGVRFVAASASCAIKDVQDLCDPSLREDLALVYPEHEEGRYYDPLVLMQCTVFSCGGFVLNFTFKHAAADGVGMSQFLVAVGELARGLPSPSVVPVRQDHSLVLPDLHPFCRDLFRLMSTVQPSQMCTLNITVKPSLVNRIKDKYASINCGRPCTVFEAVAAVLWRCRTRAIGAAPESLAVLTFSVSLRKQLGAKDGYYGNCGTTWAATAWSGAVGNGDVMELVMAIRRAKDVMDLMPDVNKEALDPYNHLMTTCWRNLGIEALDFGGGTPARIGCHWPNTVTHPVCVACLPCKDDEDYSVLSVCVKEEHAHAFLHELAHMHLNYSPLRSLL